MANLKAISGLLEDCDVRGGSIILRGTLDSRTIDALKTDWYQRKSGASRVKIQELVLAWEQKAAIPDIELGMRGERYRENAGGSFVLFDDVYIIDGLQRITAARLYLQRNPDAVLHIGFKLHFATDATWEAHHFKVMNADRTKLASNVLLRNTKEESPVTAMLYGLTTNEKGGVMHERVCWEQNMQKGELITSMVFASTVGHLHSHIAASRFSNFEKLVVALERVVDAAGLQTVRDNVRSFFEIIDQCWGIRLVTYRDGAPYLKGTFLLTLARVFSDHEDFWKSNGKRLFLDADMRRKLQSFKVHDPHVRALAASSGKSRDILYTLMVDHLNSGKRQNRLTKRASGPAPAPRRRTIEATSEMQMAA